MKITRHEAGMYEFISETGQFQTVIAKKGPNEHELEIALNDCTGSWDAESRMSEGSFRLDREAAKALVQACLDFLVAS